MKNAIYLRRRNKVMLPLGRGRQSNSAIASFLKNIEALGFTFDNELIKTLKTLCDDELFEFYSDTVKTLKQMVGADFEFKPMYPNFPQQVMDMGEAELYLNALMHYLGDWVGLRIMPEYKKKERYPLLDKVDLKIIRLGSEEDFAAIVTNLMRAKTSLSDTDKNDIRWFIQEYRAPLRDLIPDAMPHKENMVFVTQLLLGYYPDASKLLSKCFKTATDVLRLAVAISGGDISLAQKTKFKKFRRKERRLLLGLLDSTRGAAENMARHKIAWIRLGEILHPGEFTDSYKHAALAFKRIRNEKVETFGGKIEGMLANSKYAATAEMLIARPGEFARRLDHLLRKTTAERVIPHFKKVADKVATPVLLQVMAHFQHRNGAEGRTIFPKGSIAKARLIDAASGHVPKETCRKIVTVCKNTLKKRFSTIEPLLGNVYIDPVLKGYLVPFSQRSASKSLKTLVRGSRIPLGEGRDTARFFIHWSDCGTRTDIDLSAVFLSEKWEYVDHVSYTNLRAEDSYACHSGDITSAPRGACEFIDVNMPDAVRSGVRYIVMDVLTYTRQPFCEIPECYAGWMLREHPQSGEIFEPATVENKVDLASDSRISIPVIVDIVDRVIFWADVSLKRNPNWHNNIEGNMKGIKLTVKALTNVKKASLYDLFELHAKARGQIVKSKNGADTIFSVSEGTTPFDIEKIMADYL